MIFSRDELLSASQRHQLLAQILEWLAVLLPEVRPTFSSLFDLSDSDITITRIIEAEWLQ